MTPQTVNAYYNAVDQRDRLPGRDPAAAVLRSRRPTTRSTTARSAPSSATRSATASTTRAASSTATATCATGGPPTTASASTAKTKLLVAQYAAFAPLPGYTINGELTLGENIADISGLAIAYKAYHRSLDGKPAPVIDGLTGDQRFFFGFAQAWRGKARDDGAAARRSSPIRTRPTSSASTARCATTRRSTRRSASSRATRCTWRRSSASRSGSAPRRRGARHNRPAALGPPPPRALVRPDPFPRRARRALRPELPLARAADGDDRHDRVDHGVDDRQRRRARHEPRLRPRPGARAVALGRLHGGDDAVDADHAVAARALRLPPHLHRRGAAADGRRHRRRPRAAGSSWCWRCASPRAWPPACCSRSRRSSSCTPSSRGERGKAMGIFGFGVVLAPALGPSVGGVLVEWFGWRSIFFVVVPFCLVALVLARRYLPISAPGGAPISRAGGRLDVVGLGLIAVAVLALLNGMVHLHGGDARPRPGAARLQRVATGRLRLPPAARRAAADGARPVRPPRLRDGRLVAFIYGMALFGSTYLVPVFMQDRAAPAAVAGRRGAAAGRARARGDDPGRRPAGRPHRRQPHGQRRAWCCSPRRSSLMLGVGTGDVAVR